MAETSPAGRNPPLISEKVTCASDGNPLRRTIFKYDAYGREIERIGYNAAGEIVYRKELVYYTLQAGREVRSATYQCSGTILEEGIVRFDNQNRVTEFLALAPDGSCLDRQTYEYSDDNDTVEFTRFDVAGTIIEHWIRKTT